MSGGEPIQQQQQQEQRTVEPAHPGNHDSHWSWTHAYMVPVYGMVAVALIGAAVKVYLERRKKP